MTPQPAAPFTPADLARLRARHLADQHEARTGAGRSRRPDVTVILLAHALLVTFVLTGGYAVAVAAGLVPALPGSPVSAG